MHGSIYGGHRQNYGKPCSLEMNFLSRSCSCIKDIYMLTSNFIYLLMLGTNYVTHSFSNGNHLMKPRLDRVLEECFM